MPHEIVALLPDGLYSSDGGAFKPLGSRKSSRVSVRPYPIKNSIAFVREVHRRLPRIQGAMWSVAAVIDDVIVGVALVGHPQARMACDGVSLEVTRVAVKEGATNACSALYGAVAKAARAMGCLDLWTSIHEDESGHSLRAAGWVEIGPCGGGEWGREGRARKPVYDARPKIKWAAPWSRIAQGR